MTIPYERARAVRQTEQFLLELCDPMKTPRVPKRQREMAKFLLRHYPTLSDLKTVEYGWDSPNGAIQCPFATTDPMFGELK